MQWIKRDKRKKGLFVEKWFAWYPVLIGSSHDHYAWLERVWRKREYDGSIFRPYTSYETVCLEDQVYDDTRHSR